MHVRARSVVSRAVVAAAGIAVALLVVGLPAPLARAAGGSVIRKTDGTFDGYFYALMGTGNDRFLTQYDPLDFDAQAIICGARVGEFTPTGMVGGPMRGELRFEDPGNPGRPDFAPAGLIAMVDPSSLGPCSMSSLQPRIFTFGGGAGIPMPSIRTIFLSTIEPIHGPGSNDVCGLLVDTNGPVKGASSFFSNGIFVRPNFNHFNEIIAAGVAPPAFREGRAHGKPRFPGDPGLPVYFAKRPAADAALPHRSTDDVISTTIVLDNPGPLVPVLIDLRVEVDLGAVIPGKGIKNITGLFRTNGGTGPAIMNPITVPDGRTIIRLGIPFDLPDRFQKRTPVNAPLLMSIFDNASGNRIATRTDVLGLRTSTGKPDDGSAEVFVRSQNPPSRLGDAVNMEHPAIDLPRTIPYRITGMQLVAGEFGSPGQPGLDAVELRTEDFVFQGSPDLSPLGALHSVGVVDGIGEVPTGPPPTAVTLNIPDIPIDPVLLNPGDLFVCAVQAAGETSAFTAIGADRTIDTLLPYSSVTRGGSVPALADPLSNYMCRILINGEGGSLESSGRPDTWNGRSRPYALAFGEVIRIPLEDLLGN